MKASYRAQVAIAFEVLSEGLAPFVDDRMSKAFPDEDWILMAAAKLGKRRDVLVSLSDPHFQLEVLSRWWGPAFSRSLPEDTRALIGELRTARNHWAHPDQDHPFDIEYATKVHQLGEDLLRAVDSPLADRMGELSEELRWASIRDVAHTQGLSEGDAIMAQMAQVQKEYDELQTQLLDARSQAQSATGRTRAVSRQLAELQSQYAAVAGLRDQYEALQRQLEEERQNREKVSDDTTAVRDQLAAAEMGLVGLRRESDLLRDQLDDARLRIDKIDPVDTEAGRRWIWLVTGLVLTLGVLIIVAATVS
jgi:Swt1-like HEPN